jgi:hypothetical protein
MFDDEFAGQGGTYTVDKDGKRQLVPGSRTQDATAAQIVEQPAVEEPTIPDEE